MNAQETKLKQFREAEVCEVYWKGSHWAIASTSTGLIAWRMTKDGRLAVNPRQGRPAVIRLEKPRDQVERSVAADFLRDAELWTELAPA